MASFYETARRLDALQRIERKQQLLAIPPEPEEAEAVVEVKPKLVQPKKTKEPKQPSPGPQPRSSKQVQKNCDICGAAFSVQASYSTRKHTCGNPNCSSIKRSLSLRRNERWFKPKTCEGVDCCNFLDPCRQRSRQSRFCSIRCSKNAKPNCSQN